MGVGHVDRDGLAHLAVPEADMSLREARRLLNARNCVPNEIVAAHPACVTYTDYAGRVRTAWTVRRQLPNKAERVIVWTEPGLPAFPTVEP